jgi:phosphotransferase system HPr (HPr) family protein
MPVTETSVTITNKVGLHARPAALLVQTAALFRSQIRVQCREKDANAKSIMGILKLGAGSGDTLLLRAEGEDAEEAISTLADLIRRKFDEEE